MNNFVILQIQTLTSAVGPLCKYNTKNKEKKRWDFGVLLVHFANKTQIMVHRALLEGENSRKRFEVPEMLLTVRLLYMQTNRKRVY